MKILRTGIKTRIIHLKKKKMNYLYLLIYTAKSIFE